MAELATYIGIVPRTGICSVDIARGLRCTYNPSGQLAIAGIGVRGDYVTLVDGKATETVAISSLSGGGKVAVQASVVVAAGDIAYSAASGQASNVVTGAQVLGRWTQPASGAGNMYSPPVTGLGTRGREQFSAIMWTKQQSRRRFARPRCELG